MPEVGAGAVIELLADLEQRRVELRVEGQRLHCVAPSGVLTEELLARISANKQAILHQLRSAQPAPAATPDHRRHGGVPPLSYQQEQMWLAHHLDPLNTAYHLPTAARLRGRLNPSALAGALAQVVRRHGVLRTRFPVRHGRPYPEVLELAPPSLPLVDVSGLTEPLRGRVLAAIESSTARRPFDLAAAPGLRMSLVRVGDLDHRLLITRHHISSDGWSFGVIAAELSASYRALTAGRPAALPQLRRQYADFASWQRDRAQQHRQQQGLEYWRDRLDGAAPDLALVADRRHDGVPQPAAVLRRLVRPETAAAARRLARQVGATEFSVFAAALGLALCAAAGQREVVLGVAASGRPRSEFEPLVGNFATVLPLRLDLTGAADLRRATARVQELTTEALQHQDVAWDRVAESLGLRGRRYASPLFAAVLAFQNTPVTEVDLPEVTVELADPTPVAPKFPLTVTVTAQREQFLAHLEHDPVAVPPAAAADIADRFCAIVELGARSPDQAVATLVRRASPARVPQTAPGVGDRAGPTGARDLAAAFTEVAQRTPDAVAVSHGQVHVSYGELLRRARRLARRLRAAQATMESPVGICVPHGAGLVEAVLGVTLAGAVFVPLEPEDPPARQETVLTDAGISVLVTQSPVTDTLAWFEGDLIDLDDLAGSSPEAGPDPPHHARLHPDNLAYVIYTSGSTGTPKGVMVSHRNVLSMLAAAAELYQFQPEDVWTLTHSSAFDFSVWEMWAPLLRGARVVVVSRDTARDPQRLSQLLYREQVTIFSATPGAFHNLVPVLATAGAHPPLRLVVLGGERCEPRRLREWFDTASDARPLLYNMYGITETTVHATARRLRRADLDSGDSPLGRALTGWRVHVLNHYDTPVAVGGQGEITVAGAGVARGYLGQPGLTAERFRPDCLAPVHGGRRYHSGDLGRCLPGQELGYLGRLDHQLKIRGHRIEPAEIEVALTEHPGVTVAAVAVREDGERRALVAYLVPDSSRDWSSELSTRSLRNYCADRLPAYQVPVAFVLLERLPLTRNGKLDRAALPSIVPPPPVVATQDRPRTATEHALATLWCDLLGVAEVGVRDDFLEVGGDSLLVTRLHSRVEETFALDLPLRDLYQAPTIAAQAELVDRLRQRSRLASEVAEREPG